MVEDIASGCRMLSVSSWNTAMPNSCFALYMSNMMHLLYITGIKDESDSKRYFSVNVLKGTEHLIRETGDSR